MRTLALSFIAAGVILPLAGLAMLTADGSSWRSGYLWDMGPTRVIVRSDVFSLSLITGSGASREWSIYFWPTRLGYFYTSPACRSWYKRSDLNNSEWLKGRDEACTASFEWTLPRES